METTIVPPTLSAQRFSKLDQTIINLIIQQAFLKLTSNTAYLNVLNYCLERMEQLQDIRIVVIDHITTQDNRCTFSTDRLTQSNANDVQLTDARFKAHYFSCTPSQLELACQISSDNLSYLNKCLDHPLTNVSSADSILYKIIHKGWLKKRQFNHDALSSKSEQANKSGLSHQDDVPAAETKNYYRLDFIQLQHDLQTIGYDLMILSTPCNDDTALQTRTAKDGAKVG